jgi:DNA-binding NtrC family response regulator
VGDGDGALREAARRSGSGAAPGPRPSATAALRAFAGREALVYGGDEPPGGSVPESIRTSGARQAFVPLVAGSESGGVLALTRAAIEPPFSGEEIQLLFGLAASAATALSGVRHLAWLEGERRRLTALASPGDEMVGDSEPMARVRALVARAAASDATVLLLGPSGSGKELAARAIHQRSARRDGPFVAVNAAALVETLAESELFGHERGAFTGALSRRAGKIEAAHRGTLFLDEVGEMSAAVQAKLLRVLETRQLERVGSNALVKVDVRFVAATNRDLAAETRAGRFRADLYYRFNVVAISMPRLADRREDVPLLASHFLARQAEKLGRRFDGFSPAALRRLVSYPWPGNVRELANAVERAAVLAEGGLILPEDLPEGLLEGAGAASGSEGLAPYHAAVNAAKRETVASALAAAGGNVTEAARLLGLHPNYLHRLLNQLGLRDGRGDDGR